MNQYQLLTIGSTSLDRFLKLEDQEARVIGTIHQEHQLFCLNFADKIPVADYHETLGGNAANAAVTGGRLGLRTMIWTVMGNDQIARQAQQMFEKENISTAFFQTDATIESAIHTILNYQGERTILIYGKKPNYNWPELPGADWIYFTSLGEAGENLFDKVVEYKNRFQSKLVYQPGTFQIRLGAANSERLLRATDVLVLNREEALEYLGLQDQANALSLKEIVSKLREQGPKIAIVTLGKEGACASDGNVFLTQGIEDVPVVERTGAGDAYASGLVVALIEGKSLVEAMNRGLLNSQGVISKIGPQAGILHRTELDSLLSQGHPRVEIKEENL